MLSVLNGDRDWRKVCQGLAFYFALRLQREDPSPEVAAEWYQKLMQTFFEREGWDWKPESARGRLLKKARERVVLRFAGRLPSIPPISGIPVQLKNHNTLSRWLDGDPFPVRYPAEFYRQVQALLSGLGVGREEIRNLTVDAVFEQQGWKNEAQNARERLLLEARRGTAFAFGGTLPSDPGIPGVSLQDREAVLTRWLQGEVFEFSPRIPATAFYRQVQKLLERLGVDEERIETLVIDAVFEQEGWKKSAESAAEMLLLRAREEVALAFGGRIPLCSVPGVPRQEGRSSLTSWIRGEPVVFSPNLPPRSFYGQITALLNATGMPKREIEMLVKEAVFEERGWAAETETAQEKLLLAAREGVALTFGGRLPIISKMEGIPNQNEPSSLTRWLKGEKITFSTKLSAPEFYRQVMVLLLAVGVERERALTLIANAVFEQQGWTNGAQNPSERLLLEARKLAALRFGGRLPFFTGLKGIPVQGESGPLSRWLEDGRIVIRRQFPAHRFYAEVSHFLIELGVEPKIARQLILDAVFEQRGWKRGEAADRISLLDFAREWVAFRYGGQLPQDLSVKGIPKQYPDSFLSRWLRGETELRNMRQWDQIKTLLGSDGENDAKAIFRQDRREKIRRIAEGH
ncbi:MAG: hypothetical protein HY466_01665 [Deltaproteobacteria bacterium]|nr:hypothetical protein [Deltaproteobacteria bacterium]